MALLGFSALFAEPAPARQGSLGSFDREEEAPTSCGDCAGALDEQARAGLCPSCVTRRRARYCAGYYAATVRNGQVVDEDAVEPFRHLLPAALARRGLRLEREALNWVVRR